MVTREQAQLALDTLAQDGITPELRADAQRMVREFFDSEAVLQAEVRQRGAEEYRQRQDEKCRRLLKALRDPKYRTVVLETDDTVRIGSRFAGEILYLTSLTDNDTSGMTLSQETELLRTAEYEYPMDVDYIEKNRY